jgi:hypothetical protein
MVRDAACNVPLVLRKHGVSFEHPGNSVLIPGFGSLNGAGKNESTISSPELPEDGIKSGPIEFSSWQGRVWSQLGGQNSMVALFQNFLVKRPILRTFFIATERTRTNAPSCITVDNNLLIHTFSFARVGEA